MQFVLHANAHMDDLDHEVSRDFRPINIAKEAPISVKLFKPSARNALERVI